MTAAKARRKYEPVDYAKHGGDRRRMTHYLRAGGFRRIAGMAPVGEAVVRNRMILAVIVAVLCGIGLYFVLF